MKGQKRWLFWAGGALVVLIVLGVVAIAIMLVAPNGIWGLVRERTGLRLFSLGYRVERRK